MYILFACLQTYSLFLSKDQTVTESNDIKCNCDGITILLVFIKFHFKNYVFQYNLCMNIIESKIKILVRCAYIPKINTFIKLYINCAF